MLRSSGLLYRFSRRIANQKRILITNLKTTFKAPLLYTNFKQFSTTSDDTHNDFKPQQKVLDTNDTSNEEIIKQIDQLVKDNKVVLFMKGVPQMPKCGYSNFVVEIKDYKSVDILKDETLRNLVKQYSNWPTYPQLYIDGKLVGGADIINDMHKDGTLRQLFIESELVTAN